MKILICSDLHEKLDILELAIEKFKAENYNKFIFIGDACDSFNHNQETMIKCLTTLHSFKLDFPNDVILLLGNHENHYKYYPDYRCSGFQSDSLLIAQQLLTENSQLWQYYYYQSGYLFTHAGITNGWLEQVKETFKYYDSKDNLFELIDKLEQTQQGLDLLNQCGSSRGGHRYDKGGLTWCDKTELIADAYYDDLINYQVVGHTAVPEITKVDNLYFTDCLGKTVEFLTLNL